VRQSFINGPLQVRHVEWQQFDPCNNSPPSQAVHWLGPGPEHAKQSPWQHADGPDGRVESLRGRVQLVQSRADPAEHVVQEVWQASQVFEVVIYLPGEQVEQLLGLTPVQVRQVEWQQV
jgi:hypothetical protein